jgi:hypothetical protein
VDGVSVVRWGGLVPLIVVFLGAGSGVVLAGLRLVVGVGSTSVDCDDVDVLRGADSVDL